MAKMEFSDTKLMFSAHLEKAGSTIKPYAREAYLSWPIEAFEMEHRETSFSPGS